MPRQSLPPPSALLVDGDATSRKVLALMLSDLGYGRIWEAESVSSALSCLEIPGPDLAIVDLQFAEDEGYNLITLLRSREGSVGKIIAIAADADEGLKQLTLRRGADAVLARPLDWDAVLAACQIERRSSPRAGWSDGLRRTA